MAMVHNASPENSICGHLTETTQSEPMSRFTIRKILSWNSSDSDYEIAFANLFEG